jgi:DNA-binding winged helix-turn-helix (wHTH) protein/Tol biopolymer transport system component
MASPAPAPTRICFDAFELDTASGELRKAGILLRLQPQPFRVLLLLIERAGQVVTREEIQRCLWTDSTFVDFDHGINFSINQIRSALADSAENHRYIETLPRRGYRFVGTVKQLSIPKQPETSIPERIGSITVLKPSPPESELETAAPRHSRSLVPVRILVGVAEKHKIGLGAGILVILTLIAATVYGIHLLLHNRHAIPFQDFEITQLTTNGKTPLAAISPDGKYLVTVLVDNGKSALLLRHIQTNSDTQVIAPAEVSYGGVTFSPDGNYIYFLKSDEYNANDLFRVPVLGGTPQMLGRDIDTNPVFSPGGERIAFERSNDPEFGRYRLIVTDSDGTEERVIHDGDISLNWTEPVAWSADGKQVFGIQGLNQSRTSLVSFDVGSSQERSLVAFNDFVIDMAPASVEQGFVVLYSSKARPFLDKQIGFVSLPDSKLWPITRDTNNYAAMTLSTDRKTLATVQSRDDPGLYLLPAKSYAINPPNQVLAQENDISDFAWASNTELYVARRSGLFRASIDGNSDIPLILDPHATISNIASCVPGRFAAFAWPGHGDSRSGHLWRVDADGSSPKQIANGEYSNAPRDPPVCSPDGKWLYYQEGMSGIFRVSAESGTHQPVAGTVPPGLSNGFFGPDVSFDGKLLAFNVEKPVPSKPEMFDEIIVIASLDSGAEPQTQMIEAIHGIDCSPRFTPDGKALVHAILENTGFVHSPHGFDNLWLQPLDGAPGRRITNFTSGRIRRIEFSPDGQRLAILRIHTKSDVVLLHDTGASSK